MPDPNTHPEGNSDTLDVRHRAARLEAAVDDLREEPKDEPVPSISLAVAACDRSLTAALQWVRKNPPKVQQHLLEYVEQVITLGLIAANLRGTSSLVGARLLLDDELRRFDRERGSDAADQFAHCDTALLVAGACAADDPSAFQKSEAWERFVKEDCALGFGDPKSCVIAGVLYPLATPSQKGHLESAWRRDLERGALSISHDLPAMKDIEGWYLPCHEVSILYGMGLADAQVLPDADRKRLTKAFSRACLAFRSRETMDILAEVLFAYRLLAGQSDDAFRYGVQYLLGLQNADGSFGPSADHPPGRMNPSRHPTITSMWVISLARRDLR